MSTEETLVSLVKHAVSLFSLVGVKGLQPNPNNWLELGEPPIVWAKKEDGGND